MSSNFHPFSEFYKIQQSPKTLQQQEVLPQFIHLEVPIGDPSNPQMVSEYEHVIYRVMRARERIVPNTEIQQQSISVTDRALLIDWLCRVHAKLSFATNTFYLCVEILDRVLGSIQIRPEQLKLIGCVCMYIAYKFDEPRGQKRPIAKWLSHDLSSDEFSVSDLLSCEPMIFQCIGYQSDIVTPLSFLTIFCQIEDNSNQYILTARYCLELTLILPQFIGVIPSAKAASALVVARIILGHEPWPLVFQGYSGFEPADLYQYVQLIRHVILNPEQIQEIHNVFRKYSHPDFLQVALSKIPDNFPFPFN